MKAPEELDVGDVKFLGEQDGPPERDLKSELIPLFGEIGASYLAKVQYSTGEQSVALCLASVEEAAHDYIVAEVGEVFHRMFGAACHLDILFLRPDQVLLVEQVCKPFYKRRLA
jgi:hypothetical protein